ncbi:MAG: transcriptional regulator [Vicinamibacteria bacterium]
MRNAEVIRQWKILKRIERSRYVTAADLSEEHGVAMRTIRRDIEALQEAGFPLYDDRESGRKIWRLMDGYQQRAQATFTMSEMAALYFGRHLMTVLAGAPFAADLDSAFVKIRAALPEKSSQYLARISDLFGTIPFPSKDYSKKKIVIQTLIDAMLHERRIDMSYYSASSKRAKKYEVDPYRLVYHQGGLYLRARVEEYQEIRTFAVERIERIALLDETFEMPTEEALNEHSRSAFGIAGGQAQEVVLRFDADAAASVRDRTWHESQTFANRPDGSFDLTMNVAPSRELKAWIRSFVPMVRVIKPQTLKDDIERDLKEALTRWKN